MLKTIPGILYQPEKRQIQVTPEMLDAIRQVILNRLVRVSKLRLPLPYEVRIELEKESSQITILLLDEYKDHFDDSYEWLKRKIHNDRSIWKLQDRVMNSINNNFNVVFGRRVV